MEMIAYLHIQAALRNQKTFLKKAYHTTPFKIADVTEDKTRQKLQLMLMSSSPGILDEDEYNIEIEVAENCSLALQTQSYQRLFSMKKSASQNMQIRLEKGSSFSYLPHPAVPHKASNFVADNKIYLSSGCTLMWAEILTCGRKLRDETFAFTKYHNITQIFLNNRLVVKENLLLRPCLVDVSAIGQLEKYTHQASFIYINETAPVNAFVAGLHQLLSTEKEICFGVSSLAVNGIIVRILGYKAEQLYNLHKTIADFISRAFNHTSTAAEAGVYAD